MSRKKLLIGLAVFFGLAALYGPGLVRWAELKASESQLETEVAQLEKENRRLMTEIIRLREDPAYAEAIAREELGFVRPGETMIRMKSAEQLPAEE